MRRFLVERETLIGLVIFGLLTMVADIFGDFKWDSTAAVIRLTAIVALAALLVLDLWFRFRILSVPVAITTLKDRDAGRSLFDHFTQSCRLPVKAVEQLSSVRESDLLIRLDHDPRQSKIPDDWRIAWHELLCEWEQEIDRRLKRELPSGESFCYHVLPHIWLPLAFALGASVGLRRSVVLYHRQQTGQERFCRVLDLADPRRLFGEPNVSIPPPERVPADFTSLPDAEKLILHLGVTDRHDFPEFTVHPDRACAANASLVYRFTLDPAGDWLGYAQWLYRETKPLIGHYRQVDLCLVSPSALAFALGMAFSRTPKVTVCDFFDDHHYAPVFSLAEIERRLPFD
jgi:hypothetical protein